MKITYDKEADAMYIYLNDNKVHDTDEQDAGVFLDYDENGAIVGIEILEASKKVTDISKVQYVSVKSTPSL